MLRSTFCRAIISRRALKEANIVWSVPKTATTDADAFAKDQAAIEFLENADFDGELASDGSFSNPLKGLVDKAMSKQADVKERTHKLEQQSYFKPETIRLFDTKIEKVELHPDIFAANINQDHIHQTVQWQQIYKSVDMSFEQDRNETGETPNMRPWGGSGFGTEMVRDKTGPRFVGGQFSTEPRRPYISNYFRLDRNIKLSALCSCLTIKHYQNDLIIISDYSHLNRINPAILKKDIEDPECSFMILKSDRPMYAGADELFDKLYGVEKLMNVFPTNGLNVVSLLKHDKLVMDLETLQYIQNKLLFELNRYDLLESHDEPEHPMLDSFWHEVSGKWKDESFNQGGYKSGHHRFYKDWPSF